jgi:hypothetical protein
MNYLKHYNNLMNSRLLLKIDRYTKRKNGEYFEGHHIIPKYKGGTGTSSQGLKNNNIVYLTAREHFIAHWLLWLINKDRQSALAFHKMLSCNKNQNRIISSYGYEEARLAYRLTNIGNKFGIGSKRIYTDKQREHHSKIMKGMWSGEKNPFYNKKHTIESKKKMSVKAKLRSVETRHNYKGLRLLFKNNILIAEFKTTKELAKYISSSESNVRHALSGLQKSVKGYQVKYKYN